MDTTGNTILITGGSSGIGFSMAEAFLKAGNEVIICGRRQSKLEVAKVKLPAVHIRVCDVSDEDDCAALFEWTIANFKSVNILVNNAGIQRTIFLKGGLSALAGEDEIDINLRSTIYLSAQFIPHLMKQNESAIINVSSGLGFVPMAMFPVYCATKAAIHSFTLSLRHQLKDTSVKVFELILPTVLTELNPEGRKGRKVQGIQPEPVAAETLEALKNDKFEHAVGFAEGLHTAHGASFDEAFKRMNP